jgi:hypothetical protein
MMGGSAARADSHPLARLALTHLNNSRTSFLVASNGKFLTSTLVPLFFPLIGSPLFCSLSTSSAPLCANLASILYPSISKPCRPPSARWAASFVLNPTKP